MNPLTLKKSGNRLYRIWKHMKSRCFNPKDNSYQYYGERGIKVCDKWLNFDGFFEDMNANYKADLSLDRINNNGNYELNNCRWATDEMQSQNSRNVRFISYKGITDNLTNWAKFLGIRKTTLLMRLDVYGWSLERALTTRGGIYAT